MKKVKLFLALVLSAVVLVTSVPAFAADFYAVSDFPKYMYPGGSYYWAKNDLILAVAAEIFRGEQPYPPTLEYVFRGSGLNTCKVIGPLSPEKPINRASFAAILARALGLSQQAPKMPFKDVPSNEWYYPYVSELVNQDIIPVDYYKDGKFNPAGNITRLEIAIWTTNALAINRVEMHAVTPSFKDYSQNDRWHLNVDYAVGMDILKGYDDGRFGPYDAATRGQAAVMIVRMMRKLPCDLTPDEALNTIKNAEAAISKLEQAYMVDSEPDIIWDGKLGEKVTYNRIQKWQDALAQYQKEAKDYITDYNLYPWVESTAKVDYGGERLEMSYGGFDRLQKYGYNGYWFRTTSDKYPITAAWGWNPLYGFVDSVMSRSEQFPPSGPTQPMDIYYTQIDPNGYKINSIIGIGNIAEVVYQSRYYTIDGDGSKHPSDGYGTYNTAVLLVKQDGKWKVAAYTGGDGWLKDIISTL